MSKLSVLKTELKTLEDIVKKQKRENLLKFIITFLMLVFTAFPSFASERECLALAIYHEARGETKQSKLAVAHVVLNRTKSRIFPATVCEVVYQRGQFSWTQDRHSDTPRERKAWLTSQRIADRVLEGYYEDPTNRALYFYSTRIRTPRWAVRMEKQIIGNHIYAR